MMIIAVEQDNIHQLITLFQISALTFITFKEWIKALILLDNCRFLCEFVRRFDVIQWVFLQIGFICKYQRKYETAKVIIKKSLEYAWYTKNIDQELNCYEELGKICYLNYELQPAKFLHEKSVQGLIEPEHSQMRQISSKGMSHIFQHLPSFSETLDSFILSKAVNFPFRFSENPDPDYFETKQVRNQYLLHCQLECCPSNRVLDMDTSFDEFLQMILKGFNFVFEIPLPIPSNFKDESHVKNDSKKESSAKRFKDTELMTFVKLAAEKNLSSGDKVKPTVVRLESGRKKLPLEKLIQDRLNQKQELTSPQHISLKAVRFHNLDHIRLTHEQAMNREHTKKGLLQCAQKLLNSKCASKSNFTSVANIAQHEIF